MLYNFAHMIAALSMLEQSIAQFYNELSVTVFLPVCHSIKPINMDQA